MYELFAEVYHWTLDDCLAMTHLQMLLYIERRKTRLEYERREQRRRSGRGENEFASLDEAWENAEEVEDVADLGGFLRG